MAETRPWHVAYLVLSHDHPEQVEALAARVLELSATGDVVVHHDARAGALPWGGAPPPRAHLVERTAVWWGDWSVVDASLRLVRFAAESLDADWFVFLSGQHRPVVDLAEWERTLAAADIDGLVPAKPITTRPSWGRRPTAPDINYVRYAYRWRSLPPPTGRAARVALETARRLSRYAQPMFKIEYAPRRQRWFVGVPRRRRVMKDWTLYTGTQWIAFGRGAARVVLEVDPAIVDWYRQTWIPDQSFFQTVLHNQPGLILRDTPVTYVPPMRLARARPDWMALRREDLPDIQASGAAFARKFDTSVDAEILPLIDAAIDRARGDAPGRRAAQQ